MQYDSQGGTSVSAIDKLPGYTVSELPSPTKDHAVFVGWYTEPTGGERLTTETVINEDITYYAQWNPVVIVTYDSQGGTSVDQKIILLGSTLSELPTTSRQLYTFDGWYTDPENGIEFTTPIIIEGNITVYAHWIENAIVTFDSQGGTEVNQIDLRPGTSLISLPTTIKAGHEFIGWFDELEDGTEFTINTVITSDITVYAHWMERRVYSIGEEVYFNPIDGGVNNSCTAVSGNCMKFNVLKDNDDTVLLILDHNLGATVAWYADTCTNYSGPVTANAALSSRTSNWNNVELMSGGAKSRLINNEDVSAVGSYSSLPAWLYQNTSSNAYGDSNYGYWSSATYSSNYARAVLSSGKYGIPSNGIYVCTSNRYGVRPVISVLKSKL